MGCGTVAQISLLLTKCPPPPHQHHRLHLHHLPAKVITCATWASASANLAMAPWTKPLAKALVLLQAHHLAHRLARVTTCATQESATRSPATARWTKQLARAPVVPQ